MKTYNFNPETIYYGRFFSQEELESILEIEKYPNVERFQLEILGFRNYLLKEGDLKGMTFFVRNQEGGLKILTPPESVYYGICQFQNNQRKLQRGNSRFRNINAALLPIEVRQLRDRELTNQSWVLGLSKKNRLGHLLG